MTGVGAGSACEGTGPIDPPMGLGFARGAACARCFAECVGGGLTTGLGGGLGTVTSISLETNSLSGRMSTRSPMRRAAPSPACTSATATSAIRRSRGRTGAAAGMKRPPQRLACIIAARARGHAAVDSSARNRSADGASGRSKQPATEHAVTNHGSSHSANDRPGRRRRAAADLVPVGGASVIMMAMVGRRGCRNCNRRCCNNAKSGRSRKFR
jgi:hypothetical protein